MIPTRDLANDLHNAAERIVHCGEKKIQHEVLQSLPEAMRQAHLTQRVHIHDLEFFDDTYNCLGTTVEKLIGQGAFSFRQALRALVREITWVENCQSGGLSLINFDIDMVAYVKDCDELSDMVEDLKEFFLDLNMYTRKGCEKPYVTLNLGLGTSENARLITMATLQAFRSGNQGRPFIFPNIVFKVKEGINHSLHDVNYDLYQQALQTTALCMIPTYFNCDSTSNRTADAEKIGIMGCRSRVVADRFGQAASISRGNIACTTINLPQLALESDGDSKAFYQKLDDMMTLSRDLLFLRYERLIVHGNVSFLLQKHLYAGSESQDIRETLKHGTLAVGFIGLWDALGILYHTDWPTADAMMPYQEKALDVVRHMRQMTDWFIEQTGLNFSLLASSAEGVTGNFAAFDQDHLGKGKAVSEKGYYTNSFHVPVDTKATVFQKTKLEGPFHALCNGGSITYVELGEMPDGNAEAVQDIIDCALKQDCNYIGVNFPLDYCMDCGCRGRLGDTCPQCGSTKIKRLRRVSGYLSDEDHLTTGKHHEMSQRKANLF